MGSNNYDDNETMRRIVGNDAPRQLQGTKERKDTISRALGVQIMVRKRCNHEGCNKHIVKGGVCVTHGEVVKRCKHKGCNKYIHKGVLCWTHYRMSFVAAQDQDVVEGYEATTTGVGGVLCAAPSKPALAPAQSLTVSIIVGNNDKFRQNCLASVLTSSNFRVEEGSDTANSD